MDSILLNFYGADPMVLPMGLEPTDLSLTKRVLYQLSYGSIQRHRSNVFMLTWWQWRDSNSRPHHYE